MGVGDSLFVRGSYCFTQASNTPFLTQPLVNIFGETESLAKAFSAVLNESFVVPRECDHYVRKLLDKLTQPPTVKPIGPQELNSYV